MHFLVRPGYGLDPQTAPRMIGHPVQGKPHRRLGFLSLSSQAESDQSHEDAPGDFHWETGEDITT